MDPKIQDVDQISAIEIIVTAHDNWHASVRRSLSREVTANDGWSTRMEGISGIAGSI